MPIILEHLQEPCLPDVAQVEEHKTHKEGALCYAEPSDKAGWAHWQASVHTAACQQAEAEEELVPDCNKAQYVIRERVQVGHHGYAVVLLLAEHTVAAADSPDEAAAYHISCFHQGRACLPVHLQMVDHGEQMLVPR